MCRYAESNATSHFRSTTGSGLAGTRRISTTRPALTPRPMIASSPSAHASSPLITASHISSSVMRVKVKDDGGQIGTLHGIVVFCPRRARSFVASRAEAPPPWRRKAANGESFDDGFAHLFIGDVVNAFRIIHASPDPNGVRIVVVLVALLRQAGRWNARGCVVDVADALAPRWRAARSGRERVSDQGEEDENRHESDNGERVGQYHRGAGASCVIRNSQSLRRELNEDAGRPLSAYGPPSGRSWIARRVSLRCSFAIRRRRLFMALPQITDPKIGDNEDAILSIIVPRNRPAHPPSASTCSSRRAASW
jgi:hypothetical protein